MATTKTTNHPTASQHAHETRTLDPSPELDAVDLPAADSGPPPDVRDIVAGPVGSAWLTEPSTPGARGADLEKLDSTDLAAND